MYKPLNIFIASLSRLLYHKYIISNNKVLDKIRAKIEYEADYQDAYVNADIAKGMYLALEIFDKNRIEGDNK